MNNVIPFPVRAVPQTMSLVVDGMPLFTMEDSDLYLTDGEEELRHSHAVVCGVLENIEAVMEERGLFDDECPCQDCQQTPSESVIPRRLMTPANDR